MNIIEQIIGMVAPHYCLGCDFEGALLCPDCVELLPPVPPRCYRCATATEDYLTCKPCRRQSALYRVWTVTDYEGIAQSIVHKLKFERARSSADVVAAAMAQQLPHDAEWLVTNIPTATSRVRRRGYDQAQLIAKHLAQAKDYTFTPLLLRHGQQRQVGQTRKERQQQMGKVFQPIKTRQISGKHILLVDDVLTTGSTLEAAATALKAAGAKRVSAIVFAVA